MSKQAITFGDMAVDLPPRQPWARSNGMYIAGRAYLDEADQTAAQMETKWGVGRLRLLVSIELREKFDRQRAKLNQAIWHGELEGVRNESMRMVRAWLALDAAATAAGEQHLSVNAWEVALADGTVAVVVRTMSEAHALISEGRFLRVYTMEEIGRLISAWPDVSKAKVIFPGATVVGAKQNVSDPLDFIHDSSPSLDEEIPF